MTKLRKGKISNTLLIFIISIFLGILIGFQAKTVENVADLNTPYSRSNFQLRSDIKKLRSENRKLDLNIRKTNKNVKKYEKDILNDEETLDIFNEIDKYTMMSGFEDVQGPGIIIEINDLYDDYFYNYDTQVLNDKRELLHYTLNLLKVGGAEAIAVNDLRITSYTEMELASSHFEINGVSTNTPFVIMAIGDPDHLYDIVDHLQEDTFFGIIITKKEQVIIPKNNKAMEFKYANPIEEKYE